MTNDTNDLDTLKLELVQKLIELKSKYLEEGSKYDVSPKDKEKLEKQAEKFYKIFSYSESDMPERKQKKELKELQEKVRKIEKNLPKKASASSSKKKEKDEKPAKKRKREEKADKKDKEKKDKKKRKKSAERQVRFNEDLNLVINPNERKWNDHKKQTNMLKGAFSPQETSMLSEALCSYVQEAGLEKDEFLELCS